MKIGIVSTFGEAEANGSYSCALEKEFIRKGHEVKRYELTFNIMSDTSLSMKRVTDKKIREYASDLKTCDYVSIQYEGGLYGGGLEDIFQRVMSLVDACKDGCFSITFHRIDLNTAFYEPKFHLKKVKKHGLDRLLCKLKLKKKEAPLTVDFIIRALCKKIVERNGLAIVHAKRDELKIKGEFPEIDIVSHPLNYYRYEDVSILRCNFDKAGFKKRFGITENDSAVSIGVIGTCHPWKDFQTVIKALNLLDEKYHLYIFGGAHKLSYSFSPNGLQKIKDAQALVEELDLTRRVHFKGVVPKDEDLIKAFLFCDLVVMPYLEVGEMASAAMGSALELCPRIFATRNNCFEELKRFSGDAFFQFDMGNYMELADKIKNLPEEKEISENRKMYLKTHNISKTADLYLKKVTA